MRAASLLGVFIVAKALVLMGRVVPWSPWTVVAYLWQDLVVVLGFAFLERRLRHAWVLWFVYALISLYVALNVPVTALLSSPLTWPMLRAARGALADSIRHHLSWENVQPVVLVLFGAAGFPLLAQRLRLQFGRITCAVASVFVAVGPLASGRVETGGSHRNALLALVASTVPRVKSRKSDEDWRVRPFDTRSTKDFTPFCGVAAGRNVILVLLESTGAGYLRLHGAAEDPTPHLTALAKDSIVAENAYAVYPESIKGLFSVLCSQYPAIDTSPEIYKHERINDQSIASVLHEAGYRTALFHSGRFDYLGMRSIIENRGFEILEDAGDIGGKHPSSFGIDEWATIHRILRWIDSLPRTENSLSRIFPSPAITRTTAPRQVLSRPLMTWAGIATRCITAMPRWAS